MRLRSVIFWGLLLMPVLGVAAPGMVDAMTITPGENGEQTYSLTIQIMLLMTALSVLPGALMMMTSFARIVIVLSILRQAMGTAQTPSNQILIGLALFLTFFIMGPVWDKVNENAVQPYLNEEVTAQVALEAAKEPLHNFMLEQTRNDDLQLFMDITDTPAYDTKEDIPFTLLMPAFATSELKTAFQIGFLIFIPFLVIDLVVASVLMSMGMMMLSPMIISLPFKIMLFVLVDGWALIIGTLASSFYI